MKYIGLEACCLLELEEIADEKEEAFCRNDDENRGIPGVRCFDTKNHKYCDNLIFGTAKASIIATELEGNAVNGTCYFGDVDVSAEEWIKRENKWISKQQDYLETLRRKEGKQ